MLAEKLSVISGKPNFLLIYRLIESALFCKKVKFVEKCQE